MPGHGDLAGVPAREGALCNRSPGRARRARPGKGVGEVSRPRRRPL